MKKLLIFKMRCAATVCLLLLSLNGVAQDTELDRIRAVVNEAVVLDSDVTQALQFFKRQAQANNQNLPPDDVVEERLLDDLINREVFRQHARQLGVVVDVTSVNNALEQIAQNNNCLLYTSPSPRD